MTVWIITTGSSDVQLKTKQNWSTLFPKVRSDFGKTFNPSGDAKPFTVPARVMGMVYGQPEASGCFEDLVFPLLDNFGNKINQEELSRIILILTNQIKVFSDREKGSVLCPFWQDTHTLRPVLKRYLNAKYPQVKVSTLTLRPNSSNDGLDDWDSVFRLLQSKFSKFCVLEGETIYVSHQAGTPAISSAVQFASLARFGQHVKFLVSSARDANLTRVLDSSAYLKGFQIQEAKALLKRYDYSGIRSVLNLPEDSNCSDREKLIKILLDAGEQWNFAEFQKFKKIVKEKKLLPEVNFPWWQSGYESVYLAWVRLNQGATVDAMFHSFRAVEGSVGLWAEKNYPNDIERDVRKGLQLRKSILDTFPSTPSIRRWFNSSSDPVGLYGVNLFLLLKEACDNWSSDPHIKLFCGGINTRNKDKNIFKWRNNIFHRLEGLQPQELFDAWDSKNEDEWIAKVLGCLNFISGQNISLAEASLMTQVHDRLENEIASLAQSPT